MMNFKVGRAVALLMDWGRASMGTLWWRDWPSDSELFLECLPSSLLRDPPDLTQLRKIKSMEAGPRGCEHKGCS